MNRQISWLLAALLLAPMPRLEAQQSVPRIGFLSVNTAAAMAGRVAAFRQGLREAGYVEGTSIHVEYRYAEGSPERLGSVAGELVRQNVAVIVTEGPTATRAAKQVTSTIPIVMAQDPDPVATGFVQSLSRPAGNITGLTSLRTDLSAKRMEVLKRTLPAMATVTVIGGPTPGTAEALRETRAAAEALNVKVHYVELRSAGDIEGAFRAATEARAAAMIVLANPFTLSARKTITELALRERLPVIYYTREFVEDGGLMAYGVNTPDLFRRSASYVAKILKGARPSELPVELPTKFEFLINMRTAKQIGLEIPQAVLYQADSLIQ
jgi:putative ABC transport system substrate-binding protein